MGIFGIMFMVIDEKLGNIFILMDMMGMKNVMKMMVVEMKKEIVGKVDDMKVELIKDMKEILGYMCKKVIIIIDEG